MKKILITFLSVSALLFSSFLQANEDPTVVGGDLQQNVWYDLLDGRGTGTPVFGGTRNTDIPGPFFKYENNVNNPGAATVTKEQARLINTASPLLWRVEVIIGIGDIQLGSLQRPGAHNSGFFKGLSPNEDCAVFERNENNLWRERNCGESHRLACYNGFEWKLTSTSHSFGNNRGTGQDRINNPGNDEDSRVTALHNECKKLADSNGVTGNFVFAAPATFLQNGDLARAATNANVNTIWINLQDKKFEGLWKYNYGVDILAPFWGSGQPDNWQNNEHCAEFVNSSEKWNDISCSATRRVACFDPLAGNNGDWKVTANSYAFGDIEDLNQQCQKEFGAVYKFFSPITLSQNAELGAETNANVWINAQDRQSEGVWLRNRELNNWDLNQPDSDLNNPNENNLCVYADVKNVSGKRQAKWRSAVCDDNNDGSNTDKRQVACSSGGRWYFSSSAQKTTLKNFADGQKICDQVGSGYVFAAPKNHLQIEGLAYFAFLEGITGEFWINGNRIADKDGGLDDWVWNVRDLTIPNWINGQPSGGTQENCATLSGTGNGWSDQGCSNGSFGYLCFNGSEWRVATVAGNLSSFNNGSAACTSAAAGWPGSPADWRFAAPTNYSENLAAQLEIRKSSVDTVWINATDRTQEATWFLNANTITQYPNWGSSQPDDNGGTGDGADCVVVDNKGLWRDESCLTSVQYPWACSNGDQWRITKATGKAHNLGDGYKRCFIEYGADYIFAAPLTVEDAIDLDFARLLADVDRGQPVENYWINVNDGGTESELRYNLPFVNWQDSPYPGKEPSQSLSNICVFKESADAGNNNPWRIQNCVTGSAHYACFDGSRWKVATSQGAINSDGIREIIPIADDLWSVERADELCKAQFGRSYYFSAPVTGAEEFALDSTIRTFDAQQKRVWINYYRLNDEITNSDNNRWFANRLKTGVWQKPTFYNRNGSDCVVIHADGSWSDMSCQDKSVGRFACFNGNWSILESSGSIWKEGAKNCDERAGGALFAVPRNPTELSELTKLFSINGGAISGDKVWVNMNDLDLEAQWIVNKPRISFWAEAQPSNRGNRDCAIAQSNGLWYAEKCSVKEAQFACRIIPAGQSTPIWKITKAKGIWSLGFAACQREYSDLGKSEFYSAIAYGDTSAKDNNALISAAIISDNSSDPVWINFTDQSSEGAWRPRAQFSDWGMESLFDPCEIDQSTKECKKDSEGNLLPPLDQDCAILDRQASGNGTWYSDRCSGGSVRLYACTDGYEWRLAQSDSGPTDNRWISGFTACRTFNQGGGNAWHFAAPSNAVENAKLKLAMELHSSGGQAQVWINAQDAQSEGSWTVNGDKINIPLTISLAIKAGASSPLQASGQTVDEGDTVRLTYTLTDSEGLAIDLTGYNSGASTAKQLLSVVSVEYDNNGLTKPLNTPAITLVNRSSNGGAPAVGIGTSTAELVAEFQAPALFTHDLLVTLKLSTEDTAPAEAEASQNERITQIRIKAPLLAAYDFNDSNLPTRDISGNGRHAFNTQTDQLPGIKEGALELNEKTDVMRVAGVATDSSNGLDLPSDEYVVMLRISIEEDFDDDGDATQWRGILQKGSSGRQPGIFLQQNSNKLHARSSTNSNSNFGLDPVNEPDIAVKQWLNIAYVKRMTPNEGVDIYVDDFTTPRASFDYPAGQTAADNNGDLWIGNIPGAPESFIGLVDDVYLFNRKVNLSELNELLPKPPVGEVAFSSFTSGTPEYDAADSTITVELERTRGERGALDAYVQFNINSGTADEANSALVSVDSNPTDIAFVSYETVGAHSGSKVSWIDGDKANKTVELRIDTADDGLPEGTETAELEIKSLNTAVEFDAVNDLKIGTMKTHSIAIEDLTPNEFGNFAIWAVTRSPAISRSSSRIIEEGNNGEICIFRDSGSSGDVTVSYQIISDLAQTTDYTFNGTDGASNPAITSITGSVQFEDKGLGFGGTVKCFSIDFVNFTNDSDFADPDTPLTISITDIDQAAKDRGSVLTQQRQAQLFMREVAPGLFGFLNKEYTCSEIIPGAANSACSGLEITRLNYSRYAQASTLSFNVEQATAFDNSGEPTAWASVGADTDFFPILTSRNTSFDAVVPSNFLNQRQSFDLSVINDNDLEQTPAPHLLPKEVFRVTIVPTVGQAAEADGSSGAFGQAIITVTDETAPAFVELNSSDNTVVMGEELTHQIARSGNPKTEFSINRVVEYIDSQGDVNLPVGCNINDFIDGLGSQTLSFNKTPENHVPGKGVVTAKTTFRGNDSYKIRVRLKDDNPTRAVWFEGVESMQDSFEVYDVSYNPTVRENTLLPSGTTVANPSQPSQGNDEGSGASGTNSFYAITKNLAKRTKVNVTYTLPSAVNLPGCSSGFLRYNWVIADSVSSGSIYYGSSILSGESGNIPVSAIDGNVLTLSIELPYTYVQDVTTSVTLNFQYAESSVATSTVYSSYTRSLANSIITKPRWRQLISFRANECVAWDDSWNFGDLGWNRYEPNYSCNNDNSRMWTYDPVNKLLLNKGDSACASGLGHMGRTSYAGGTPSSECTSANIKWDLVHEDSNQVTRITIRESGKSAADGEIWCNFANARVEARAGSTGDACNGNDRLFRWGND